ncbi:MAG: DUF6427 family protein [Salinivirgaceae bacterium]|jgi:hypothetical protein|nr:DUF6427 family protein [Salinivirgaceae bacterium]
MLLKLFKSNHPSVIFLIPILGIILWIPSLFELPITREVAEIGNTTLVYKWVLQLFSFHPKASVIFALILVIVESYILIRLNFKYIFIENKTYLPSVIFVVLTSVVSSYQMLHPLLLGNLFVLLALDKAFLFEKSKHQFKRYFESGFFLGLGALIYPNIYVFIFAIWLTLIYLRTFNWREWFSSVLGIITPFIFYLCILFLTNNFQGLLGKIHSIMTLSAPDLVFTNYSVGAFIFLSFVIIISIFNGARVVGLKKISTRKYFALFFWFAAYVVALFYLHPSFGYELSMVFAIPVSIICTGFFTDIRRNWIGEVIFTLTLIAVFVIIWFQ